MLKKFQRQRLYDAVAEALSDYISQKNLKTGDRLPSEHDLCEQLGVGRTSLREALRSLQNAGVVDIKMGRGIYVRGDDLEFLLTRVQPLIQRGTDLWDLSEVRELLEVHAARLAAERRSQQHLAALQNQLQRGEEKASQGDYRVEDDLAFHSLVFEASGNKVLLQLTSIVGELMRNLRQDRLTTNEMQSRAIAEHRALYEAIEARRSTKAASAMRAHVRQTASNLLEGAPARETGGSAEYASPLSGDAE